MASIDLSKLTDKEKIKLISKIHDSMESHEVSPAVKKVLDKRLERIENGSAVFFTLDESKNRIARLK